MDRFIAPAPSGGPAQGATTATVQADSAIEASAARAGRPAHKLSPSAWRVSIHEDQAQVTLRDGQLSMAQASKACEAIVQQLGQIGISARRVYANGTLIDWLSAEHGSGASRPNVSSTARARVSPQGATSSQP
jgi:hypothetical protein